MLLVKENGDAYVCMVAYLRRTILPRDSRHQALLREVADRTTDQARRWSALSKRRGG